MAILITAASKAKAYQLKNTLSDNEIYLGDYEDLPEVMVKSGKMIRLPNPSSATYIHEILALCLDMDIIEVYALHQTEFDLLNEALQLFEEYGISIKQA